MMIGGVGEGPGDQRERAYALSLAPRGTVGVGASSGMVGFDGS